MGAAQHARVFLSALKRVCFGSFVLGALALRAEAAPPDVTALFPAGGALGEEVQVTATGTFAKWPVQIWTSDDKVHVECGKDKGKLSIRIENDAQLGICWLRFIDEEGASAPRPFVVSHLPSVLEKEPNESPKQSQKLAVSAIVHGKFDKRGDADSYAIELSAGQTLVAQLQANEILGSPADGALQICSESGQVLVANQDAGGIDSLAIYQAKQAGTYLVRTFALPAMPDSSISYAGGENYIYRLTITTGPYADYSLPLAIGSSEEPTAVKLGGWNVPAEPQPVLRSGKQTTEPWYWTPPGAAGLVPLRTSNLPFASASDEAASAKGQPINVPSLLTCVIAKPREVHRFSFAGTKGTKLAIGVESSKLGYDLDPQLKLRAPDGSTVNEIDDMGKNADPSLNVTLASDGDYLLEVRDVFHGGGPRYVYRLTIEPQTPSLALTVAAGSFLLEKGKPLEIPVTIARQNGFSEEVIVSAVELPEGITVAEATSTNKGDSAKQVKLKLTAEEGAKAGPIRIVATTSEGKEVASATFAQTLGGSAFQHSSIWVGVK
jgi:hypothetical protein